MSDEKVLSTPQPRVKNTLAKALSNHNRLLECEKEYKKFIEWAVKEATKTETYLNNISNSYENLQSMDEKIKDLDRNISSIRSRILSQDNYTSRVNDQIELKQKQGDLSSIQHTQRQLMEQLQTITETGVPSVIARQAKVDRLVNRFDRICRGLRLAQKRGTLLRDNLELIKSEIATDLAERREKEQEYFSSFQSESDRSENANISDDDTVATDYEDYVRPPSEEQENGAVADTEVRRQLDFGTE